MIFFVSANSQPKSDLRLEQLWKTVDNNPNDLVNWTLLLQYCEHLVQS